MYVYISLAIKGESTSCWETIKYINISCNFESRHKIIYINKNKKQLQVETRDAAAKKVQRKA